MRTPTTGAGAFVIVSLFEDGSDIGQLAVVQTVAAAQEDIPFYAARRMTPTNASHTYSIRAWANSTTGTPSVLAGVGGDETALPMFIRITRVAA